MRMHEGLEGESEGNCRMNGSGAGAVERADSRHTRGVGGRNEVNNKEAEKTRRDSSLTRLGKSPWVRLLQMAHDVPAASSPLRGWQEGSELWTVLPAR